MSFFEWYAKFKAVCGILGYLGPIDRDSFMDAYASGFEPKEKAIEFVEEMNDV